MAKENFERTKPHVNIGTIGHVDHGKTELTSSLVSSLFPASRDNGKRSILWDAIDNAPEEKERGITINTHHVEYESRKRHFNHVDFPGHTDFVKNAITGAAPMDGALLIVDPTDVRSETLKEVSLAWKSGIRKMLVFMVFTALPGMLDKCDPVATPIDTGLSKRLAASGFEDPKTLSYFCGDLNSSDHKALLDHMDHFMPLPEHPEDGPLRIPIEDAYYSDDLMVLKGKRESGVVNTGEKVDIIGFRRNLHDIPVEEVVLLQSMVSPCQSDIMIKVPRTNGIKKFKGGLITNLKNITAHSEFKAEVYILKKEERGRPAPLFRSFRPQFYFRTTDVTGTIQLEDGREMVMPGDNVEIAIKLRRKVPLEEGQRFAIREGGRTVGAGQVTSIY